MRRRQIQKGWRSELGERIWATKDLKVVEEERRVNWKPKNQIELKQTGPQLRSLSFFRVVLYLDNWLQWNSTNSIKKHKIENPSPFLLFRLTSCFFVSVLCFTSGPAEVLKYEYQGNVLKLASISQHRGAFWTSIEQLGPSVVIRCCLEKQKRMTQRKGGGSR